MNTQSRYTVVKVPGMSHEFKGQPRTNPCPSCHILIEKTNPLYFVEWKDNALVSQYEWLCASELCLNLFILGAL
jgi:hypothetical protein